MNLDEIERRANAATPGPWTAPTARELGPGCDDRSCVVDHEGCAVWPWHRREDMEFAYAARTDVPALIARVRELEAEQPCAIDQLDATMARMELHTVTEERNAFMRSHLILKAIHGALTDALPTTPIPAIDSFDVVELVRNIVSERDQALADYQDIGRGMHEECSRLEAECERMKTFAAENFSAMIRQEVAQMREYGLSYEGVRKVMHEYNDGEISFGKLMDLIRAASRAMAEDMNK